MPTRLDTSASVNPQTAIADAYTLTATPSVGAQAFTMPGLQEVSVTSVETSVAPVLPLAEVVVAAPLQPVEVVGAQPDATPVSNPYISVEDQVVSEGDGYVDVVLNLSAPGTQPVTVSYTTVQGTAYETYDYGALSGSVTFDPGETTKTVRVTLQSSASYDDGQLEHFRFVLSAPTNGTLDKSSGMISIVDNDNAVVGSPTLYVRDVVVDEKAGTAKFVVLLGGVDGQATGNTVTVDYATHAGTAGSDVDFQASADTLTFAPGQTVKTVEVNLTDDLLAEGIERFTLQLSNASNAVIVDGTATATIGASDAANVVGPTLSVADMVIGEGDGYVDVVVTLSAPSTQRVSVAYSTPQGTAYNSNYDYTEVEANAILTFEAGETTKTVRIELGTSGSYDDGSLEHFRFDLASPTNASLGKGSAMISIVDNDNVVVGAPQLYVRDVVTDEKAGTATFVVTLGNTHGQASSNVVTVEYATSSGTAATGSDFAGVAGTLVFGPGETVKTIVVDLKNDTSAEKAERFDLTLSNASNADIVQGHATATIGANDGANVIGPTLSVADTVVSEGDGYVDVVVTLSGPTTQNVSVAYETVQGTAYQGNYDYNAVSGTLNFAAGETTKTVRIELGESGSYDDGQLEHFLFNLKTPINASLSKASGMVSIVDNDNTVVGAPELYAHDVIVDEKAGTATFVVTLGNNLGQASNSVVSVHYETGSGTATTGNDFAAATGTLVFGPGETVKTVVVDLNDDTTAEVAERFNLTLSSAVNATIVDARAVATIGANDGPNVVGPTLSVEDTVVSEGDGYIDVLVRLSGPTSQNVSVAYSTQQVSANDSNYDYTAVSGTLNFAAGETTKTVRIELGESGSYDSGFVESFRLNLGASTNATVTKASGLVVIVDNDNAVVGAPGLYVRDAVVDEKAGTATYSVLLGGAYGQASNSVVTVDYHTGGGTATSGADYSSAVGTLVFGAGETVKTIVVDLKDDTSKEALERINLTLTNAANANIVDANGVAVIGASDGAAVVGPTITVADMLASESDGYIDVVVKLSAASSQIVQVTYATQQVTAYEGNYDYNGVNGTLSFAAGETTKTVRIQLGDSASYDTAGLSEQFRFNLSAAVNGAIGNTSATVTIVDDDLAGTNVYSYGISDDVYNVVSSSDIVVENAGGGDDLVLSSVNYTLGDQVENLTLTGSSGLSGTGNTKDNKITGNSGGNTLNGLAGNDTLDGAGGNDQMYGGIGNDTYVVAQTGDKVFEISVAGGNDSVVSSVTYALGLYVENLTLAGSAKIDGTGNGQANRITGNSNANLLTGLGGNDTLDGGLGNDTLVGGTGNDTYVINSVGDTMTEGAGIGNGIDTVQINRAFTLGANFENLTLTGLLAINGIGNTQNNVLVGNGAANSLSGLAGNDTLNGGLGADTMIGGVGNDTYVTDSTADVITEVAGATGGVDTVQSTRNFILTADLENLSLLGSAALNGVGNAGNNKLVGNAGANTLTGAAGNDTIDGGAGADKLVGGTGNDTYVVDNTGDVVTEVAGATGGTDTVLSSRNHQLTVDVENLTLTGTAAIGNGNASNNVIRGNAVANTLNGGGGNDDLSGDAGADTLNGGGGADTMRGGLGSDLYYVDNAGDVVIDVAGTGSGPADKVISLVSHTLAANVENLTLTGTNVNGTGNASANTLVGSGGANVLTGGAGGDHLTGAAGTDTFVFNSLVGYDTVTDFRRADDSFRFSQAAIHVGNGDTTVNGGIATAASGDFQTSRELVIFTSDIFGEITRDSAAGMIGSAHTAFKAGDDRLFVVDNGDVSAIYLFQSSGADKIVSASELTLIAMVDGFNGDTTSVADYTFSL